MSTPLEIRLSNGRQFPSVDGLSLLDSAAQAGLVLEHSCRTGRCGACKTRLLGGSVAPVLSLNCLTEAERNAGWVLTCASRATSDVHLDTEDLGALADLKLMTLPARIDELKLLSDTVMQVRLRLPPNHGFRYLPGQYVNLIGPGGLKRAYSIANAPSADGKLEFHIKRLAGGQMSRYWFEQAKANDLLRFEGPRGSFFLRPTAGVNLLLLATGTGYAPIQALLQDLAQRPAAEQPATVQLVWGGRTPADFYQPAPELPPHCPPLRYSPTLSRPDATWQGERGYVQDVVLRNPSELGNTWVYACGLDAMINSAQTSLTQAGLPTRQFFSDAFVAA